MSDLGIIKEMIRDLRILVAVGDCLIIFLIVFLGFMIGDIKDE